MGRGLALLWVPLALLWAAWGCEGRIRNDGADELFVEYEDYELPDNETGAQHSLIPCVRTLPHPTSCSVPAAPRRSLRRGRQRANGAVVRAPGSAHDREWEAHDALEWYGFDIAPCLASGCTEDMLNNERCDEQCNHDLCDYGPPPAIASRPLAAWRLPASGSACCWSRS